jgi:hypothetical protein
MATRNWDSLINGFWDVAENWSEDILPATGDDAVLDVEGEVTVTHRSGTTALNSLISEEILRISGGSLTVQDTAAINALLSIQGGTAVFNGSGTVQSFVLSSGILSGNGSMVVESDGAWSNGSIFLANLTNQGNFTLSSGNNKNLTGNSTLTNESTITHTAGNLLLNNATLNNTATGVYEIQAGNITWTGGSVHNFNNSGLFRKTTDSNVVVSTINTTDGTVEVQGGSLGFPTTSNFQDAILSIAEGAALNFNAGNHTLGGNISGAGAGVVRFNGGTISSAADTTLNFSEGGLNWSNGTLTGGKTFTNQGDLTLSSGNNKNLTGNSTLTNESTITHIAGNLLLNNATLNNTATGVYEIQAGNITWTGGSVHNFNNSGLFRKTTDSNVVVSTINTTDGTIEVQGGSLGFPTTSNFQDAVLSIAEGAALNFNAGNHTLGGNISGAGAGVVRFNGGTISSAADTTLNFSEGGLNWSNGTLTGGKTFTNQGDLTLSSGNNKNLTGNSTLTNESTITHTAGNLLLNNATLNNTATGVYEIQAGNITWTGGSVHNFNNSGLFRKSSTATSTVAAALNNTNGTVNVEAGVLNLNGGGNSTDSTYLIAENSVLNFGGGTHFLNGTSTASGQGILRISNGTVATTSESDASIETQFEITGGTLTANGTTVSTGVGQWSNGTISGAAGLTNQGDLTLSSGNNKNLTGNSTLTNESTITHTAGNLLLNNATLNNTATGVYDIQAGNITWTGGSVHNFNNSGLFRKTTDSNVVVSTINTTDGTVEVQGGSLGFPTTSNFQDAILSIAEGAALNFNAGNHTLGGNISGAGAGVVRFNGGTISSAADTTLNFSEGGLNWSNGTLTGGKTFTNQGDFILSSGNNKNLTGNSTLTNESTITHTAGNLLLNDATLNNTTTGVYEIQSGAITWTGGSVHNFNNTGLFRKSSIAAAAIAPNFVTSGTVDVQAGTLAFIGGYTQVAGITRLSGGTLSSSSPVAIQGGSLEGFGQVSADVNSSGELNPGVGIGTLNLAGDYTQSATGVLNLEIGGLGVSEFDRLNISGDAIFDGTLKINFIDGYVSQLGDVFNVGTFGSVSGNFSDITIEDFDESTVDWELKTLFENGQLILAATQPGLDGTDLEVQSVTTPVSTTDLGQEIEVRWTVKNLGDTPATPNWSDRIYLSTDPNSLENARELLTIAPTEVTTLEPGQEYSQTATVKLPLDVQTPAGSYYLLVETDALKNRPEISETNNFAATASTIDLTLPPLPDVVVSAIVVPAEGVAGEAVQIRWTLTNQGEGDATGTWTDEVYLSGDNAVGQDTPIDSFEFTGTIPVGESIERVQTIRLPASLQDDQYVVVRTDASNQLFEQGSEDNNVSISEQSISVLQPALPNLQIASVTPPVQAASNQSTVVAWTVTNAGNGPATTWYDQVWLSFEPRTELGSNNLPDPTDIYLGQVENASFLNPGESYNNSLEVPLPEGISGNYYFHVYSNVYSYDGFHQRPGSLLESTRTDNVGFGASTQIELTPPPDLQVTGVISSTQAFSGEPTSLTWTVSNEGVGTTLQENRLILFAQSTTFPSQIEGENWDPLSVSWIDKVYLSLDEVLNKNEDIFLGSFVRTQALVSGESYSSTQNVTLPIGISGNFYLIVETDSDNTIFEGAFEDNNQNYTATPIQVNLTPPPDLGVEILSIPANPTASRDITIRYRVSNDGSTSTPNSFWTDAIYLSTNSEFDPATAQRLGEITHYGRLEPEASYENSVSLTLPDGLNGDYFIFVSTDNDKTVFEVEDAPNGESTDFSPNVASQAVTITSQPADLVVSSASTPETAEAGKATRVEWTVSNVGTGDTAVENWVDQVIVSDNDVLGDADDRVLASFSHNGLLDAGESYTRNELVTLPNTVEGQKHLFVVTDTSNSVYEVPQGKSNASAALPITLPEQSVSLANLEVTQVNIPEVVRGAELLTVNWMVQNSGGSTTDSTVWYDSVYLSSSSIFDRNTAILLGEVRRTNPLEAGKQYPGQQTFFVPVDAEGEFYVFVETDSRNQVSEPSEGSNLTPATQPLTVVAYQAEDPNLPPPQPVDPDEIELPADLTVTAVDAPTEGQSGQPLAISWTVLNNGEDTGNRAWFDVVYLSQDQVFDRANDFYLGAVERTGLKAGDSYQVTQSFNVPKGLSGPLYAFVVTDSTNRINDTNSDNNVAFDSGVVQISPIPPADIDLATETITVPTAGVAGQSTTVEYTVTNQGTETISGTWYDSVYLSKDEQWDIDDVLLGQVEVTASLNQGDPYTRELTTAMPGVVPGDYHVIVRSDIRNNFAEVDEANNLAVSTEQIAVDVQALDLDTPINGTLEDQQAVYYRVDVEAGETLRLTLDSLSDTAANELYVSYDGIPTRGNFDYSASEAFTADQEVIIPSTLDGSYYVLAYGNSVPVGEGGFDLTADLVEFGLTSSGLEIAGNSGPVTFLLEGAKLDETTTFELIDSAGNLVIPEKQVLIDSTQALVTFDLTDTSLGEADIKVTKGASTARLENATNVQSGNPGELFIDLQAPEALRPGQMGVWHINYANNGNTDIGIPILTFNLPGATFLGTLPNGENLGEEVSILGSPNDQLTIPFLPGKSVSIPLYGQMNGSTTSFLGARVIQNVGIAALKSGGVIVGGGDVKVTEDVSESENDGIKEKEIIVRTEVDKNDDGIPDEITVSTTREITIDSDGDGIPNKKTTFKRVEIDDNGLNDGREESNKTTIVNKTEEDTDGINNGVDLQPDKITTKTSISETTSSSSNNGILEERTTITKTEVDSDGIKDGNTTPDKITTRTEVETALDNNGNGRLDEIVIYTREEVDNNGDGSLGSEDEIREKTERIPVPDDESDDSGDDDSGGGDSSGGGGSSGGDGSGISSGSGDGSGSGNGDYDKTDFQNTNEVASIDPNDILGPKGFGQERWITSSTPLNYTIRFENDPIFATAAAQTVRITQQLDDDLDFRTFRVGDFGFGDIFIDVPDNRSFYQERLDLTDEFGLFIDFTAGINVLTGEAFWEFTSIDPTTGQPTADALAGFLPPNLTSPEGEGFVNYSIRPDADAETGAVIDAEAVIIFDNNEPIDTPPIFNTLDAGTPSSTVEDLPTVTRNPEFLVNWSGTDDDNGSGLANYTVYVSENGGEFTPWLENTQLTEATYLGEVGNTYEFYVTAIDNAGNSESLTPQAQAYTRVGDPALASIGDHVWNDLNANGIYEEGEPGLQEFTINLYDDINELVDSVTTNETGNYSFVNLNPGEYTLELVHPPYLAVVNPDPVFYLSPQNQGTDDTIDSDFDPETSRTSITLNSGENLESVDAGLYQHANLYGKVFDDVNGNGQQDEGEPGLSNWTVYLNPKDLAVIEQTTQTATDGSYVFWSVDPGEYRVFQAAQDNWQQTIPTGESNEYAVTLFSGDNISDLNFGNQRISGSNNSHTDFDQNGYSDIVWRSPSGQNFVWFLEKGIPTASNRISLDVFGPNWKIEGVGDLDGDGLEDDLIWRNYKTYQNAAWLTEQRNGQTTVVGGNPLPEVPYDNFLLQGLGDFDGDDKRDDLIWFNPKSTSISVWFLDKNENNSITPTGSTRITVGGAMGPGWEIAGVGSFDGDDGDPTQNDILWRNYLTGQTVVWLMDGTNPQRGAALSSQVRDTNWRIEGVSDFDGNGIASDILWRNTISGRTDIWFMDGVDIVGGVINLEPAQPTSMQVVV